MKLPNIIDKISDHRKIIAFVLERREVTSIFLQGSEVQRLLRDTKRFEGRWRYRAEEAVPSSCASPPSGQEQGTWRG
jgi:hypothetical protein